MRVPPRNNNWEDLGQAFAVKLLAVFGMLEGAGLRPWLEEGLRTVERQAWIYAEGRTRQGDIRTKCDGLRIRSNHQARPGSIGGWAADVRFLGGGGRLLTIPAHAIEYRRLGAAAEALGLRWGGRFGVNPKRLDVSPVELPTNEIGWDVGHVEFPPAGSR